MNAFRKLQDIQQTNNSMICLGLDLDVKKMPAAYADTVKKMYDFACQVIEATKDLVCAYKPNLAFYESLGAEGLSLLRLIIQKIPEEIIVILDGKRGDIANTASHYAQALYEHLGCDWVTLNPYMGYDSMRPFLEDKNKGAFILCLTSNTGSKDFQLLEMNGKPLYEIVAEKVAYWNKEQNLGLVVGATHPDQLAEIRKLAGDMPILIPGVGAQGGALEKAALAGTGDFTKTALINVSRSVLYASNEEDFAQRAREELEKLNGVIKSLKQGPPQDNNNESTPPPNAENNQPPQQPNGTGNYS